MDITELDKEMKEKNMITVTEILTRPPNPFLLNAHVNSLQTYNQFLEMRRDEMNTCQKLKSQQDVIIDDEELKIWYTEHFSVFTKVITKSKNGDAAALERWLFKKYKYWLTKQMSLTVSKKDSGDKFEKILAKASAYGESLQNLRKVMKEA